MKIVKKFITLWRDKKNTFLVILDCTIFSFHHQKYAMSSKVLNKKVRKYRHYLLPDFYTEDNHWFWTNLESVQGLGLPDTKMNCYDKDLLKRGCDNFSRCQFLMMSIIRLTQHCSCKIYSKIVVLSSRKGWSKVRPSSCTRENKALF